ncbi:MAG: hypothetical protein QOJ63_376 [Solirubrobacteraceae bacterium]|nr:hypothetical protein [Solirubrobacteraceae bacterium]
MLRGAEKLHRRHYVGLDYPPGSGEPRYTQAHPHPALHAALARHDARYLHALERIRSYDEALCGLELRARDALGPSLINDYLPGLDSAAIYAFIRDRSPARYVEVGSGNSTKFAARAKADAALATTITSIDPRPRTEIDALCDSVLRMPLEDANSDVFSVLEAGDVVFFDGSHSVFMGNDVAVFLLEVLPALAPGVLVGIHDVYLPFDYPQPYADLHYTEQYVLAAYLLAEPPVEIVLPAQYVLTVPSLRAVVDGMWDRPGLGEVAHHGVAFWMQTA